MQTSAVIVTALASLVALQSAGPDFRPIDGPGAQATIASAINVHGEIVGRYTDANGHVHAFLIDRTGSFRTLDFPGASFTIARGISDRGDVVGRYETGDGVGHGYVYSAGQFTRIDYPGPPGTDSFPWSINERGTIVGRFTLPDKDGPHGFVVAAGMWTRIDHPGAKISAANGINNAGEIVGIWFDDKRNEHSYRFRDGVFSSIDVPGATRTLVDAIVDSGTVSGTYRDATGTSRAYAMTRSGCVTTVDNARYPGVTVARGISASGVLVGQFLDPAGRQRGYVLHGYPMRVCP